jgi:hypothetical protein
MNSREMKTKILHHYRFKHRYRFIATEVSSYNSDVLVDNGFEIYEIEIKTSKADLLNEGLKRKHILYRNSIEYVPNRFYFAIPSNLYDVCLQNIINPKYGIIIVFDKPFRMNRKGRTVRNDKYVMIKKKALPLHKTYNDALHHDVVMRMGSELIRLRITLDNYLLQCYNKKE